MLAVNYAKNALRYKHIVMVGLSGGGWTTTVSAAIDPRIELSMPIAGSVPRFPSSIYPHWVPDLPGNRGHGKGGGCDFEQNLPRPLYHACGWACLYTLAALDTPSAISDGSSARFSLQMLHEHDSCCFATAGLHANITAYNRFVQAELSKQSHGVGYFATAANLGNFHEIVSADPRSLLSRKSCRVLLTRQAGSCYAELSRQDGGQHDDRATTAPGRYPAGTLR